MKIIRDGKEVVLTEKEIRSIVQEEHVKDIRYEIEQELSIAIENEWISFDNYADFDYPSPEDAKEDFIELIIEHVLEQEETDYNYPTRYIPDYKTLVVDFANDFDYWGE